MLNLNAKNRMHKSSKVQWFMSAKNGFTFFEVLIVLLIITVFVVALSPVVTCACGGNSSRVADVNNLKQIMSMYIKHRADSGQTWVIPRTSDQIMALLG